VLEALPFVSMRDGAVSLDVLDSRSVVLPDVDASAEALRIGISSCVFRTTDTSRSDK
jgi:hypothetical protein